MIQQILLVGVEAQPAIQVEPDGAARDGSWKIFRIGNGTQALDFMAHNVVAAVISEDWLPDMSAARLLGEVQRRHPHVTRFLAVDWEQTEAWHAAGGADHFFLPKPYELTELPGVLQRARQSIEWLDLDPGRPLPAPLRKIPAPPSLYHRVLTTWKSPRASLHRMADLIARDQAATRRLQAIVRLPAFGLSRPPSRPFDLVTYLGVEATASLLLLAHVCVQFANLPAHLTCLNAFCTHAVGTARTARAVARCERLTPEQAEQAFTAGLLHDLGKVVLTANVPDAYARVQIAARSRPDQAALIEQQELGITHATLGAWLLALWGLPLSVVAAVAFHHNPLRPQPHQFLPVDAVHIANILDHGRNRELGPFQPPRLSLAYLIGKGLAGRETAWLAATGNFHGPASNRYQDPPSRPLLAA